MGLQHRQDHGQPVGIPADHRAPRRTQRRRRDQRLDLDQQRARALHAGEHRRARRRALRSPRNSSDGLATSSRPAPVISNTPISSVGPKRFLTRAQDAEVVAAFALEIEHAVDHVLDHPRAGDLPVLGDVADEDDRGAGLLGVADQRLRGGAHLGDGARRRIRRGRSTASGSNRRSTGPAACPRRASPGCPPRWSRRRSSPAPGSAPGDRRAAASGRPPPRRKYRRRAGRRRRALPATCSSSVDLPMPGSPPTSRVEPRTKPPPVTRSNSAMPERMRGGIVDAAGERGQRHRRGRGQLAGRRPCANAAAGHLLDQRVPFAAIVAFSLPARADGAAILASERLLQADDRGSGHAALLGYVPVMFSQVDSDGNGVATSIVPTGRSGLRCMGTNRGASVPRIAARAAARHYAPRRARDTKPRSPSDSLRSPGQPSRW